MAEVILSMSRPVPVEPVVEEVTLHLSLAEALYVAGVLGQSNQNHPDMQGLVTGPTVWDTLVDALAAKGINRHVNEVYMAADRMVRPAFGGNL